jgi:hypothetical protein
MKLHPVLHGPKRNRFCGPSALSAITGLPTDDTARMLRELSGRRSITGTSDAEMFRVLQHLGFNAVRVPARDPDRPKVTQTLASWLKLTPRPEGVVYLVSAGNHWQVISGRRYVCGVVKEIVSVRDKRVKRRARVRGAWKIERRLGAWRQAA